MVKFISGGRRFFLPSTTTKQGQNKEPTAVFLWYTRAYIFIVCTSYVGVNGQFGGCVAVLIPRRVARVTN